MKTNLLSKLTKNLALKIISIIIAIVIWYVVVDFNDPIETESLQRTGGGAESTYVANGKEIYRIEDEYRSVTVYITANRSRLERIQANNIRVTGGSDGDRGFQYRPRYGAPAGELRGLQPERDDALPDDDTDHHRKRNPAGNSRFAASAGTTVPGSEYEVGTLTPEPPIR